MALEDQIAQRMAMQASQGGAAHKMNAQGQPVRPGMYNYNNRHGVLQDISQDGVVSFADTFLGDLLGFDGRAGAQGAGMSASIGGARRGPNVALEQVAADAAAQSDGVRQGGGGGGNNAPTTSTRPQTRPDMSPEDAPIDDPLDTVSPSDEIPRDENGNPMLMAANAAAAGAAIARLIRPGERINPEDRRTAAITPNPDGTVRLPIKTGRGGVAQYKNVSAQEAADLGWTVVGINYPDGGNALSGPTPAQIGADVPPAIDMIDGVATDTTSNTLSAPLAQQQLPPPPRQLPPPTDAMGAEDMPIDDPMSPNGTTNNNLVRFGMGDNGSVVFRNMSDGTFVARYPDGTTVQAADQQKLKKAMQAIRAVR